MRVTRAKQYRKHLRFFRIVYNIGPPYKVILDGNFIHGCISMKVDIKERLNSVLQGASLHLYVPRAAREELKALGPACEKAYQFAMRYCRTLAPTSSSTSGGDDGAAATGKDPAGEILAAIGPDNSGKYMVASQDEELRVQLRRTPGCPLLFVSRTVLVLEQPSCKSKSESEKTERMKSRGTTEEEEVIVGAIKRKEREDRDRERAAQPQKRLKKKAKGPNPLSCKRSTKVVLGSSGKGGGSKAPDSSNTGKAARRQRRKSSSGKEDGGGGGGGGKGVRSE